MYRLLMTNSKSNWQKSNTYRAAAWVGNYQLLPDIIGCIVVRFINFRVAKCMELMARSMEV